MTFHILDMMQYISHTYYTISSTNMSHTQLVTIALFIQSIASHTLYYHAQVGVDDGPLPQLLQHGQQQRPVLSRGGGDNGKDLYLIVFHILGQFCWF